MWVKGPGSEARDDRTIVFPQVPMLRSKDHSEEEGYEQEEQSSKQRESAFAASASVRSMDDDGVAERGSKAQVGQDLASA